MPKLKFTWSVLIVISTIFVNQLAHADTLAGVVYGGGSQSTAVCYLFNTGTGTISIISKAIQNESGALQTIAVDGCGSSLAPNRLCAITARIGAAGANGCKIVLSPDGDSVRGSMDVRDTVGILANVELR